MKKKNHHFEAGGGGMVERMKREGKKQKIVEEKIEQSTEIQEDKKKTPHVTDYKPLAQQYS